MRGYSLAKRSAFRCCSRSRTVRRTTAPWSFRDRTALTVPEKEAGYGIKATHQAGGNVRYVGDIAAEVREPQPLKAGEMVLFHPGIAARFLGIRGAAGSRRQAERMSISLRVDYESGVELRDEAFPEAREDRDRGAALHAVIVRERWSRQGNCPTDAPFSGRPARDGAGRIRNECGEGHAGVATSPQKRKRRAAGPSFPVHRCRRQRGHFRYF